MATLLPDGGQTIADLTVDWWRQTASALAGACVAMLTFWLSHANEYITAEDAKKLIAVESPYVGDKRFINETLIRVTAELDKLSDQTHTLSQEIQKLRTENANAGK